MQRVDLRIDIRCPSICPGWLVFCPMSEGGTGIATVMVPLRYAANDACSVINAVSTMSATGEVCTWRIRGPRAQGPCPALSARRVAVPAPLAPPGYRRPWDASSPGAPRPRCVAFVPTRPPRWPWRRVCRRPAPPVVPPARLGAPARAAETARRGGFGPPDAAADHGPGARSHVPARKGTARWRPVPPRAGWWPRSLRDGAVRACVLQTGC